MEVIGGPAIVQMLGQPDTAALSAELIDATPVVGEGSAIDQAVNNALGEHADVGDALAKEDKRVVVVSADGLLIPGKLMSLALPARHLLPSQADIEFCAWMMWECCCLSLRLVMSWLIFPTVHNYHQSLIHHQ